MTHNADKRAKAAQKRYKWHQNAQVWGENRFSVGQLAYMDIPPLSTSPAHKKAVEANSKFLNCSNMRLEIMAPSELHGITILWTRTEFQTLFLQTGHRCHSFIIHWQDDIVSDRYSQPLSETPVRNLGKWKNRKRAGQTQWNSNTGI